MWPKSDLGVEKFWQRMGLCWNLLWSVATREAFDGDQLLGFWSQEAMECVYGVSFIRRKLDVHRFEKVSHGLLGCWILTQH